MLGFNPTNLASTRFSSDESQWPSGSRRRSLFGQALLYHPYHHGMNGATAESSSHEHDKSVNGSVGGRFLDEETLESVYRQKGDAILDDLLATLHDEGRPIGDAQDLLKLVSPATKDIDGTANSALRAGDQAWLDFIHHVTKVPSWVDYDQIRRGQGVFLAYAPAIGATLYYRSLVPGFSIPKIAKVLTATAYLAPPASRELVTARLVDTGAFVAALLSSRRNESGTGSTNSSGEKSPLPPLAPHSTAWTMALQVRVLHAKVRRRLLQRQNSSQGSSSSSSSSRITLGEWNTQAYGIPINQEDLAATLLGFSYNSMLGCEMILGRPWPIQERLDYLAFWRYVGWLLGVETNETSGGNDAATMRVSSSSSSSSSSLPHLDPCGPGWYHDHPDPLAHVYAMFGSILLHLSKPDASSVEIAHHLLRLGKAPNLPSTAAAAAAESKTRKSDNKGTDKDDDWWFYFRSYHCRRFAGHALGDALCLPYHPVWYRRLQIHVLSTCYLWLLRLYSWAAWHNSPFRGWIVQFHQQKFDQLLAKWQDGKMKTKASTTTTTGSSSADSMSSCPFAMVRPPQ